MRTDQDYVGSPGPGQGILALTEQGWPTDAQRQDDAALVLAALEQATRALYRAHQALAPHVGRGPGLVSQVWAFGLELAVDQAASLVPADRHQALFDPALHTELDLARHTPSGLDATAGPADSSAVGGLVEVERLVLEADSALRTFLVGQGPAGTAELVRMVLELLVDLRADSRRAAQRGRPG